MSKDSRAREFFQERLIVSPDDRMSARELYAAYCEWFSNSKPKIGQHRANIVEFGRDAREYGLSKRRLNTGITYFGIAVRNNRHR